MNDLKVFKIYDDAELPEFGTKQSACFDLKAYIKDGTAVTGYDNDNDVIKRWPQDGEIEINPGDRLLVETGLIFKIPEGYKVDLHPRSGNSLKKGMVLANSEGKIDNDYYHQVYGMITNISESQIILNNGDKMMQGEMVAMLEYGIEVTENKPEQSTDRVGGFGSTDS